MALNKDWREFLELLNSRGVDYVIVDAQSLAFHGRPRNALIQNKRAVGRPQDAASISTKYAALSSLGTCWSFK